MTNIEVTDDRGVWAVSYDNYEYGGIWPPGKSSRMTTGG
jgi:hypothetical protein